MNIIYQIKNAIDIREFIGQYTELTQQGRTTMGCCPIHGEHKPSMAVYDTYYRCFSCGSSGSVIDFYMAHNDCDLKAALAHFCKLLNISEDGPQEEIIKPDPYISSLAPEEQQDRNTVFLNDSLITEYAAIQHVSITDRFSEETIKAFRIGYCVNAYDREMYNRITIPVYDIENRLIGIVGRKIHDEDEKEAKYRFTSGFSKSATLYGLNLALPYIRQKREIIICEGTKDVWVYWDAGIRNVVASFGCKLSDEQVRLAKKYALKIVCSYDNDYDKPTNAGEDGFRLMKEQIEMFYEIKRVLYGDKNDPGQCSNEEIIKFYTERT